MFDYHRVTSLPCPDVPYRELLMYHIFVLVGTAQPEITSINYTFLLFQPNHPVLSSSLFTPFHPLLPLVAHPLPYVSHSTLPSILSLLSIQSVRPPLSPIAFSTLHLLVCLAVLLTDLLKTILLLLVCSSPAVSPQLMLPNSWWWWFLVLVASVTSTPRPWHLGTPSPPHFKSSNTKPGSTTRHYHCHSQILSVTPLHTCCHYHTYWWHFHITTASLYTHKLLPHPQDNTDMHITFAASTTYSYHCHDHTTNSSYHPPHHDSYRKPSCHHPPLHSFTTTPPQRTL